jgi:hypothetical protein
MKRPVSRSDDPILIVHSGQTVWGNITYVLEIIQNPCVPFSGRGVKPQLPKTNLPPRFQRQQQQQQQQGYDDAYIEQPPQHSTVFRRRGSGRRSFDGDMGVDRSWRRNSSVENGADPGPEEQPQVGHFYYRN